MNEKYKLLMKDTVIFAVGSLGSKLILFFLVPLYTNVLSTAEYGTADLISVFSTLLIPVVSLSVEKAVIRYGMKPEVSQVQVLLSAFFMLLCACLATVCLMPLAGLYPSVSPWRYYLGATVLLSVAAEIERAYLKVKGMNKAFSLIGICQTAVLALANVLLLTVFRLGVKGYLTANLIALAFSVLVNFFAGRMYRDLRQVRMDWGLLRQMLRYSAPLVFSGISWWVLHSSDKVMIEWLIDASALGLYAAATKIPSLIHVIISVFNQAWGLSSIREMEAKDEQGFFASVFRRFTVVLFGAGLLFLAVIKPFMQVYVGHAFREAWVYVPFLLFASVFYAVFCFVGSLYAALQRTANDMRMSVLCAVLNVIINYFGIRRLGIGGAVLGTAVSYCLISTLSLLDVSRYVNLQINTWRYALHVALLLTAALAETFTDCHVLISLACLGVFLLVNHGEVQAVLALLMKKIGRKRG